MNNEFKLIRSKKLPPLSANIIKPSGYLESLFLMVVIFSVLEFLVAKNFYRPGANYFHIAIMLIAIVDILLLKKKIINVIPSVLILLAYLFPRQFDIGYEYYKISEYTVKKYFYFTHSDQDIYLLNDNLRPSSKDKYPSYIFTQGKKFSVTNFTTHNEDVEFRLIADSSSTEKFKEYAESNSSQTEEHNNYLRVSKIIFLNPLLEEGYIEGPEPYSSQLYVRTLYIMMITLFYMFCFIAIIFPYFNVYYYKDFRQKKLNRITSKKLHKF